MRDVPLRVATVPVEILPQLDHLLGGVEAPASGDDQGFRPLALKIEAFQIVGADAEIMRHLRHREASQCLLGVRRKFLLAQLVQLAGDFCALREYLLVELERGKHGADPN